MKHQISVTFTEHSLRNLVLTRNIRNYIQAALDYQKVWFPCEINVLVTDDDAIRAINLANRKIDSATDVLSFPMFTLEPGKLPENVDDMTDPETGRVPLGDMAISMEHVQAQAQEFGHSENRELGYLCVHSILHLLGYDHLDEGEMKAQMRKQEEAIMTSLSLTRS